MQSFRSIGALTGATALLVLVASAHAQNVTGAGASFPAPLYAKWADAYNKATGAK
ncbi:MAG: phosphate ABC transporter substrate-binding protein PstS, partial [Aquincola sp.]|nr:phosphate ABC transporter substrate-binding protein PstS [Aquincola sp.]